MTLCLVSGCMPTLRVSLLPVYCGCVAIQVGVWCVQALCVTLDQWCMLIWMLAFMCVQIQPYPLQRLSSWAVSCVARMLQNGQLWIEVACTLPSGLLSGCRVILCSVLGHMECQTCQGSQLGVCMRVPHTVCVAVCFQFSRHSVSASATLRCLRVLGTTPCVSHPLLGIC